MKKTNLRWLLIGIICLLIFLLGLCLARGGDWLDAEAIKNDYEVTGTNGTDDFPLSTKLVATATKQVVQATEIKVEIFTPTADLDDCECSSGSVQHMKIPISYNTKEMNIHIYLPSCYSENEDVDYPLLILLHGQSSTADQWLDLGLKEYLDMVFTNQERGIIVVLPEENDYLLPIIDSSFDDMVVNDLLTYLEENYHVSQLPEERAIGGISRGATWALKIALNYWEEFGVIGLHSYPGGVNSTILLIQRMPENAVPAIYIDAGINDIYLNAATALNEELNQFQIPHEWHLNEGSHTEGYWSENLQNYLKWYMEQIMLNQ